MNWVKETQPAEESALPGLVWAITPHDARFTTRQNLDEAVQHLLGKPGLRWGTLQAWTATACSASSVAVTGHVTCPATETS